MTLPPDWDWSLKAIKADRIEPPEWGDLRVGHIDTGIYKCAMLGDWVLWEEGANFVEPDRKQPSPPEVLPSRSWSLLDIPAPYHGTRTASVLCGYDNKTGFRGVAPRLPIVPIRANDNVVLDRPVEQDRVGNAIFHALEKKCQVITISLGMPSISKGRILGAAVDAAYEQGVIVCGAGGQYYGATCYPGKFFRAICVGGYKKGVKGRWPIYYPYNGTGSFVDVWAPAHPILRAEGKHDGEGDYGTDNDPDTADDDTLGKGHGTSYATPAVAAAAAYWLKARGKDIAQKYGDAPWKRVEAFRLLLKRTAVDLSRNWGLENTRLPWKGETIPSKGNDANDGLWISGGLNIAELVNAPLPDVADERKERPVIEQCG